MTEFEEYLRGTFEINNGIENDIDTLVRIHAPELLKLAKKELMKDAIDCNYRKARLASSHYLSDLTMADVSELTEVADRLQLRDRDKVKVIIIKE